MRENIYLSKNYTNCLRGIFAILVVIHHIYQYSGIITNIFLGVVFQLFGFLAVSVFFFFSGYGLMVSSSKANYVDHFFTKRFLPLYCFNVVLIFLYAIWTLLLEKHISLSHIMQSFFFGRTVITNGWYLQATFVAYLLFIFCFKLAKTPRIQMLTMSIAIFVYCLVCWFSGLSIYWYQTIPCLVFGMVYCHKKKWIDKLLAKYALVVFISSSIVFSVCYLLSKLTNVDIIFEVLYSLFLLCATITLSYLLCNTKLINNSFFAVCGDYSLEIYISHGFFLRLNKLGYIENKLIYVFAVILGTIILSVPLKMIYKKIVHAFTKRDSTNEFAHVPVL